jgi:hypothetical protein
MSGSTLPTTTCPAPMTRASLIALRDAGGLNKDCDYVITDHVQGRLVAGTTIHLQAVDANTLSIAVNIKTPYDNVAWSGIYDIDIGVLLEVTDALNNTVRGILMVSDFDWGNSAWTNNLVDNASVTVSYGNSRSVSSCVFSHGASVILTGWIGGLLSNCKFDRNSTFTLTNGNASFINCIITNFGAGNFANYTAGNIISGLVIQDNGSLLDSSNTSSAFGISDITIRGGSAITRSGATAPMTGFLVDFMNYAFMTQASSYGAIFFVRVIASGSNIIANGNGGAFTAIQCQFFGGLANVMSNSTGNTISIQTVVTQQGRCVTTASGSFTDRIQNTNILADGLVQFSGTRTSNNFVASSTITSGGTVDVSGSGVNANRLTISDGGTYVANAAGGCNASSGTITTRATLYHNGNTADTFWLSLQSVIYTGANNHTNFGASDSLSKVLTAPNVNKFNHMGLPAQLI